MEHKVLIIGGGIAAVLIGGVFILKARASANAAQQSSASQDSTAFMPNAGYYYSGSVPSSAGYASAVDTTTTDPANSGSTSTGGGFDISSLLGVIAAGTVANNAAQVASNGHTADSAILSGISIPANGSVSVNHTDTGTTISTTDPTNASLTAEYQTVLGRAPDAVGLAYWTDRVKNGATMSQIESEIKTSPEYLKAHPNG